MNTILAQTIAKELVDARIAKDDDLHVFKRKLAKRHGSTMATNATLLEAYRAYVEKEKISPDSALLRFLRRRDIRTLSGVAPITVLTKPFPCPGRCVYCPTETNMPKSYIASEPAAQRALSNAFDPVKQVASRISQLEANGHVADKIELIVLGGTWSFYKQDYQQEFIKGCFDAANEHESKTLDEAITQNETTEHRIIGVTLETRPDYVSEEEMWRMRNLACTHIQIGVQSLDQAVLDLTKRDDSIDNIARATKVIKSFGFKFTYHIMPGLPGSTPEKDIETVRMLFSDERFQPDMLKIYPTVVVKSSLLYHWWKAGKYKPYDDATLRDVLIEIKKLVPPYVRINRLIRDIPGTDIIDGNLVTNLRQKLQEQGVACQCIRCREARNAKVAAKNVELEVRPYDSSGGKEHFISFESKDRKTIYAFVRLYCPDGSVDVLGEKTAFIRELHTYGELMPVDSGLKAVQHIGFGKRLMAEAEQRAKDAGYKKLAVISGVGVREYYRKLGFSLEKTYMVKSLSKT